MQSTPLISVALPVYNAERYVAQAIESILAQSLPDFELLIVDDGSTDASAEVIRSCADRDARIRVVSRENRGLVASLNEMLGLARGMFLARMDADDISHVERFARQVSYLKANPDVAAVGCRGLFIDPDGAPLTEFHDRLSHEEIEASLMQAELGIIHPAAMMRTALLRDVGGYRPEFVHAEDLDLFLRLGERGRLANLADVLISYRVHPQSVSHLNHTVQRQSAWRAIDASLGRRGRSALPAASKLLLPEETELRILTRWGWWAHGAGHLATAWKYATRLVRRWPLHAGGWKLMACLVRDSAIRRWDRPKV